jgi:hypothetical protein
MEADKVLTSSILDILFEGRNKEYGAYELRKHHNRRVLMGLLGVALITGLLFIVNALVKGHADRTIQAISGPDAGGLRDEAIRVIRKSGQWLPAIQNGSKVKSYKKQPVIFMMASQ